jgi:IS5 family transposase
MNNQTFFMQGIMPLVKASPVWQLHELLDWQAIERKLVGLYQREASQAGGPIPYSALSMFKLMLLGQWHNLSDPQLEHTVKVRVDFMAFTGFEPDGQGFPDATTICRYRNRLVKAKLDTALLHLINTQLQTQGLKVQHSQGAILDATLITSAARPKQWLEASDLVEPSPDSAPDSAPERSSPKPNQSTHTLKQSADPDATWVKKGKKSYFGYRGYAIVEADDGYVEHVMMRPANESETHHLAQTVSESPNKAVELLADKGFASKANRDWLQTQGIGDFIQHKKVKGIAARDKLKNFKR